MLKIDQPLFGFDFEVTSHIRYILTHVETGEVVFDDTIIAQYSASVSDAFAGVKRMRLANEGSAQKNIAVLLNKLSELQIKAEEISLSK